MTVSEKNGLREGGGGLRVRKSSPDKPLAAPVILAQYCNSYAREWGPIWGITYLDNGPTNYSQLD